MANATEWEPGADQTLVRAMIELFKGTSSTSLLISDSGSLSFITQPYLYFDEGQWILLIDDANSDNWMAGQVTTYNGITGATVFAPKVKHGTGTISDWLVYMSGAWVDNPWTGGTVTNPSTFNADIKVNADIAQTGDLAVEGVITSTAGEGNLNTTTTLADANATITAAQLFGGTLVIEPTVARILTLPTAAQIIAYLTGYAVGSKFEFVVVNNTLQTVTLAAGTGIVQLGKTIVQDGSAVFKVVVDSPTIVSIINESTSVAVSRSGAINSSLVQSSAVDITLTNTSPGLQSISMTEEGNSVKLPDATQLFVSSPTFVIFNAGYYPFGIKDSVGNLIIAVEPGGEANLSLLSNLTAAGSWTYSGSGLTGGLITLSSVLSSSYVADATYNKFVALTDDITIHFAKLSGGGLAIFMVNHATRTMSIPRTVSVTAGTIPLAVFKIDATSCIIFYSDSGNNLKASVAVIVSNVLIVGAEATTGVVANISVETGYNEPKIAQLDTNLFLVSYATAVGAGVTAAIACQVSSTTVVTWGTAANINTAADNQSASTITEKLTTTTGLVLYKLTAAPFNLRAVVISVTNAVPPVCTIGTAVTAMASDNANASSYTLLSATECVVADNDNTAGSLKTKVLSIAGAVITVGTSTILDTGLGVSLRYTQDGGNRFTPHIKALSSSAFLWWFIDSLDQSRMGIATVTAAVITGGNKVTGSFRSAAIGASGYGQLLPIGTSELLAVVNILDAGGNKSNYILVAHKFTGNVITVGKILNLDSILAGASNTVILSAKLSNGIYAICNAATSIYSMDRGIQLVKTDGINIKDLGVVGKYAAGLRSSDQPRYLANTGSKLVTVEATQEISAPATAKQLRVTNILTQG